MAFGIDVYTAYQKVTNWNSVRGAGVEFVYIKVSDGTATRNEGGYATGAKRAGIKAGAYHYAQPGNAVAQANLLVNRAEATGATDLAPALDLEAPFVPGVAAANFAVTFLRQVKARGHRPCLYANNSMMSSIRARVLAAVPDCIMWVARYGANPSVPYHTWQYSQSGHIAGISASSVDLNTGNIPLNNATEEDLANVSDAEKALLIEAAQSVLFGVPNKRNAGPLALTSYDIQQRVKDVEAKVDSLAGALDNLNAGANSVQFGETGKRSAGDLARTLYDVQQTVKELKDALVKAPEVTA